MPDTTGTNGLREDFRVVGKANLPGLTSYAMAAGVAKYGTDFTVPGMLFAKILRSPYAHARVRKIDEGDALAIPGVLDVVKWDDPMFLELGRNPIGGFDKMIMKNGEEAMRAEFERILPVMKSGYYVPGVDHQTPPDVPLERYHRYVAMLEEFAFRAVREG